MVLSNLILKLKCIKWLEYNNLQTHRPAMHPQHRELFRKYIFKAIFYQNYIALKIFFVDFLLLLGYTSYRR